MDLLEIPTILLISWVAWRLTAVEKKLENHLIGNRGVEVRDVELPDGTVGKAVRLHLNHVNVVKPDTPKEDNLI